MTATPRLGPSAAHIGGAPLCPAAASQKPSSALSAPPNSPICQQAEPGFPLPGSLMRPCGHTGHHAIPFPANDPARPDPVHPRSGPLGHGTFPGPWPRLLLSPSPPPNLPPELPQDPGSRQNLERRSLMAPSSLVAEVHSPAQNHGLQDTHGRIHIPVCSGPVPGEGTGGEPGVLKRRGARGVEAAPGTAGAGRPP